MKLSFRLKLMIFLFIVSFKFSSAQNLSSSNSIAINLQKAIYYFPEKNKMEGNVYGGELIYRISTVDKPTDWVKRLNVQSIDLIFNFKNLDNLNVKGASHTFGQSYSSLAGLNVNLFHIKAVDFNLLPAVGLGYSTKSNANSGNELIGSRINLFAEMGFGMETSINKKTSIFANVSLFHFSNAAMKLPNLGINMSSLGFGIARKLNPSKRDDSVTYQMSSIKRHHLELGLNFGKRGVDEGGNKGLYKNGFYLGYNYNLNSVVDLGIGTDAVYYHTVYDIIAYRSTNQSLATSFDHWRLGVAIGPALNIDRLNFSAKYGYYLHFNNPQKGKDYWTFGIKYNFTNWLAAETKLYVHKVEADYFGVGLSFCVF